MSWLTAVVNHAHANLLALDPGMLPRQYLRERGVTDEEIITYKIGYWADAPEPTQCSEEFWKWCHKFGYNRLTFPLTDPFGTPIGVQARHLGDKGYENFVLKPRELFVPCFGLHVALPEIFRSNRVVLVEGVFDYLAASKVAKDSLATLTANLSNGQRRLLSRYVSMAICLFDMDKTGRRGCYKLAGLEVPPEYRLPEDISKTKLKPPPFQVVFPFYSAHDPDDLRKQQKWQELQKLVSLQPVYAR